MINYKWFSLIYKGVSLTQPMLHYQITPTKRTFWFYGIRISWLMIGVTVVAKDEQP
jgi:hypothetical protein